MFKVKMYLAVSATLAFAMLTACGDGFKGNELVAQTNHEQIQRGEGDIVAGDTAPAVDEQAVAGFVTEREQTGSAANASLASTIKALSMVRTDVTSNGTTTVNYRVRMLFGCGSNQEMVASSNVDTNRLRAGETVSLGRNAGGQYEFLLACTDSECGEAVVTVRSIDPTGVNALVHYGMRNEGIIGTDLGGLMTMSEYTTRRSTEENFYTEATVAWYLEQCLLSEAELALGEGLSGGNTGVSDDLFGTQPSGNLPPPFLSGQGPQ